MSDEDWDQRYEEYAAIWYPMYQLAEQLSRYFWRHNRGEWTHFCLSDASVTSEKVEVPF